MAERETVEVYVGTRAGYELGAVLDAVAYAACEIAARIRLAAFSDTYGAAGAVNVQGEQQQKLDVVANDLLMRRTRQGRQVWRPW